MIYKSETLPRILIPGISLITAGAARVVPLILSFEILTGTDPTFTLAINDVNYPLESTDDPLVWRSRSEAVFLNTGLFTLVINGTNLISNVEFVSNFTVDSPIKNVITAASDIRIMLNGWCYCHVLVVGYDGWMDGWMDALYFPFREYITVTIYTGIYTHLYDKMFIAMGSACLAHDLH